MKHMIGLLAVTAGLAMAQGPVTLPAPAPPFGGDRSSILAEVPRFDELKAFLGLTDQQVQQLTQLQTAYYQANQTIYNEMAAKQRILYEQMESETPNGSIAGEAVVAIANLRKQLSAAERQVRQNAGAILTEAQKPKLAQLDAARSLQPSIWQAQTLFLLDGAGGHFGILPARAAEPAVVNLP